MIKRDKKHKAWINISGEIFETYVETLERFPTTLLGDKQKRCKYLCAHPQQYFFERNRRCFEAILYFYQSYGTLNCPIGMSIEQFADECRFFKLPEKFINHMRLKEGIFPPLLKPKESKNVPTNSLRSRLRDLVEDPATSSAAWSFGMISLVIIWSSIITASIETLPVFRPNSEIWSTIELSINIWFVLELFLRASLSDDITKFLKDLLNIVDVLALLPYFLLLIPKFNTLAKLARTLKTLKFLRVCRLFRFTKHSKRLIVALKIVRRYVLSNQ